uniref:Enoyl reductase (ER) domain-containing protein n=1 Tax=Fibrocapsa japonica TaxID=94617 RepID=A0A7S2V6U7_9STRA|mmetsp:Transcript_9199/g.14120  ORF Transcript_9199/g.14120 Transcript_9199/m.14120 type:complete len:352 (+) Transcript_9199:35-1090(+)|eukprot:CAMPEP_0113936556 /NCGR_PEP_ID=MMETSP1339-20121228/3446_1 /TAXON_ID=94617 /ORGANISM="Fibrocapsa japonica" /LENGTH=351 /DNA_ID=CAMNT_0000939075 /DNA_START=31 /DNA_END=1086 /DNA_ORIENTATION=+ /assembly_acc=CAM_ASM_000762
MKAIQIHKFVEDTACLHEDTANDYLSLSSDVLKPSVLKKNQMLVQVLACSISPGDIIMIQGNMIMMHPSSFPYVPGMDICGRIVDHNNSLNFQNGDIVVAANGFDPVGGLAEYMVINNNEAVLKPQLVSNEQAASSSSSITARNAVMDHVKEADRVLVLGGSGGVGSAAIQIAKRHAKASFVATTSTQIEFCKELGADQVIDYRKQDWWNMSEFQQQRFDVIIDTVGGGNYYDRANLVGKNGNDGGKFIAVTGDEPKPDCRTVWKLLKFFGNMAGRLIYSGFKKNSLPKYVALFPYDEAKGRKEVLDWMQKGSLTVKLDETLPFTAEGVCQAFAKVGSGHAHGKVVVHITE